MRLTIVVHVKTRHDRPSFSVYNYGILTYDSCKRKMWLDFAVVLEYKYRMSRYDSCKLTIFVEVCPKIRVKVWQVELR